MTSGQHAQARIRAIMISAQINAKNTGADPAECIMELLVAAAVISARCHPHKSVESLLAETLPDAVGCAESWFPAEKVGRA